MSAFAAFLMIFYNRQSRW